LRGFERNRDFATVTASERLFRIEGGNRSLGITG
jgi:hypothetical protein